MFTVYWKLLVFRQRYTAALWGMKIFFVRCHLMVRLGDRTPLGLPGIVYPKIKLENTVFFG